MDSSSLSAHFRLEAGDIDAFSRFLDGNKNGLSPGRLVRTLLVMVALLLVGTLVFKSQLPPARSSSYAPRVHRSTNWVALAPAVLPGVMFPIFYFLAVSSTKKARQNAPILQHPSTVTLSDQDFRVEFGSTSTTTRWDGVPRVENTPTHLFLFIQPKDGFIVPRRAFDSDEEFARFCDLARRHQEAARPLAPQPPPIAQV